MAAVLAVRVFGFAIFISTTHFHVSENLKKHRHSQALLAMSVFAFFGQDGDGKIRLAGFCQVKSRQTGCSVTDFKARTGSFDFD